MNGKLKELSFGVAGGTVSALGMLLLGVLGSFGYFGEAAAMMEKMHLFFNLTPAGIILGAVEAFVCSFIFTFIFAWTYNRSPF